jgi:copper transport protein
LNDLLDAAGGAGAVLTRAASFAGIAGVVGAAVFRAAVVRPATAAHPRAEGAARIARAWGLGAAIVLCAAVPLRVVLQARGLTPAGDPWWPTVARVTATAWGHALAWQAAAAMVALAGFWRATHEGGESGWWHAMVAGAVLVVTPAMSGHAMAVERGQVIAVGADIVHVAAAGVWAGGLAVLTHFAVGGRRTAELGPVAAALIARFHTVATVAVAAAVVTGAAGAWVHLRAPGDLIGTGYGRILVVKLALVGVALALGARHARTAGPRAARAGTGSIAPTLLVECFVLCAVLTASGLLAGSPSPGSE